MPARKLKEFLDEKKVPYVTITHSPAYTTQAIAHSAHVSGKEMAKTVILKQDGRLIMAVLPGNLKVDTELFRRVTEAEAVELAEEREFKAMFPGCEVGAMPPFGNLWEVPVFVDEELSANENIIFNAGTHTELMQMRYEDFAKLVKPEVLALTSMMV